MIDIEKLKALAEAATRCSGPMRVETDYNGVHQVIGDGSWKILNAWHTPDGKGRDNAEFCAAANPAAVLELIAEITQLKAVNFDLSAGQQMMEEEIARLKSENDDGLAVLRTQKEQLDCYIKISEDLKVENEEFMKFMAEISQDSGDNYAVMRARQFLKVPGYE